jgi:hypothetical protein
LLLLICEINHEIQQTYWLKLINGNLKYQPKQFWNYVSKFRKDRDRPAQFQVGGIRLTKPDEIANAFSKHF